MANNLDIEEALLMSKELWEKHKDSWWPMQPEHGKTYILYMIEEIGEVISIIKKKGETEIIENSEIRTRFIEEMCDIMMYYSDVLNRFEVSSEEFSEIYRKKFEKNMRRDFKKDHKES